MEFCNLLYSGELNLIDHDERILLIQTIDKCIVWDDEDFEIPDGQISFNGESSGSASIMFVATKSLAKDAIGIISLHPPEGIGLCTASVGLASTNVYHVGLNTQLEPFYRFQMCFEKVSSDEFHNSVGLAPVSGKSFEHRRTWIQNRFQELAESAKRYFMVDACRFDDKPRCLRASRRLADTADT